MRKYLNKIIHKLLNFFGYRLLRNEDRVNFKLDTLREKLSKEIENEKSLENFLIFIFKNHEKSKSQIFQDLLVDYILNKKDGVYCEVGALDGLIFSNTYYLEKELGWSGILCEPNKKYIDKIKVNRPKNILIDKPVFSIEDKEVFFTERDGGRSGIINENNKYNNYKLRTTTLNLIFSSYLKNKNLDYLSIDTEGTEFEIIKYLDFDKYKPKIISIEHNYDIKKRNKIFALLQKKNYKRIFKSISRFDDWYIKI